MEMLIEEVIENERIKYVQEVIEDELMKYEEEVKMWIEEMIESKLIVNVGIVDNLDECVA